MFTGIIEETGSISAILKNGNSIRLTVHANKILQDIKTGDSIAVNGICLTAAGFTASAFTADVMHETIARTSLSHLRHGSIVNLERAMSVNGRFGGTHCYRTCGRNGYHHKNRKRCSSPMVYRQNISKNHAVYCRKRFHCNGWHQSDGSKDRQRPFLCFRNSPHDGTYGAGIESGS